MIGRLAAGDFPLAFAKTFLGGAKTFSMQEKPWSTVANKFGHVTLTRVERDLVSLLYSYTVIVSLKLPCIHY